MKDYKIVVVFSLFILNLLILSGCADSNIAQVEVKKDQDGMSLATRNDDDQTKVGSARLNDDIVQTKVVVISDRCRGCGKCARTASDTFAMKSGKAIVISQEYANSSAVKMAINNCYSKAIEIQLS